MKSVRRLMIIGAAIVAAVAFVPAVSASAAGPAPATADTSAVIEWTAGPFASYDECREDQDLKELQHFIITRPCYFDSAKNGWFFRYTTMW